ncbi:MAG: hypothetical protein V7603_3031 [Micromonosporaceae bacterium]
MGAARELDDLRTAGDAAVAALLAARPRLLVVLGSGPASTEYFHPFRASFAGFGIPVELRVGSGEPGGPALPLSLAMGMWLLHRAGSTAATLVAETIATGAPVEECVEVGERYARQPAPVGLLVMGDGSARRSEKAPGYLDPRAEEFDATVTKALAGVDTSALLALDPGLAAELMVAGRAPWQVLAAAAHPGLSGEVLYDAAPYGVNYTVAVWR